MNEDEKWMKIAIEEAILAMNDNEIPVGAILVHKDKLIARAHNQPIKKNDPSAHAEIQALRIAGKKLKNYRLKGLTLYVTLEPCAMCLGAIMHARISRIVFGASDSKKGVCGSCLDLANSGIFNHKILIDEGILEKKCSTLLNIFFRKKR